VTSSLRRSGAQQQTLRTSGHRIRVLELQGELIFSTVEPIVRQALKLAPYSQYLVLACRNVVSVDAVAARLIGELATHLREKGVALLIAQPSQSMATLMAALISPEHMFPTTDAALEHCENHLLVQLTGTVSNAVPSVVVRDTFLLEGMGDEDVAWLDAAMGTHAANAGEFLIHAADLPDTLYLLLSGTVEVRLPDESGAKGKRLDVFSPGMNFGEMGFLDGSPRSADVIALEPVVCRVIDRSLFQKMELERPQIKIRMLEQIARHLSSNLRRANTEAMTYKG
jgi:glutaminase